MHVKLSCLYSCELRCKLRKAAIYLCLSQNLHLMEINCTFATAEHPELACPCAVVLATTEISVVAQLLELVFWKVDFTGEPAISTEDWISEKLISLVNQLFPVRAFYERYNCGSLSYTYHSYTQIHWIYQNV